MTIKDEMKPKEEAVKNKKVTVESLQYEILKQKKCNQKKDKRIKKIEEYFKFRNKLIWTILLATLCSIPFALHVFLLLPIPECIDGVHYDYIMFSSIIFGFVIPLILGIMGLAVIWVDD